MGLIESKDAECCTFPMNQKPPPLRPRVERDSDLGEIRMSVWTSSNVLSIKLCEYAATDHADGINHLCEKQGAVIYLNFLNEEGYAPLHLACMKGAAKAAVALVGHGADVGMKSRDGMSAVQYARKVGHTSLAEFLESVGKPQTGPRTPLSIPGGARPSTSPSPHSPNTTSAYSSPAGRKPQVPAGMAGGSILRGESPPRGEDSGGGGLTEGGSFDERLGIGTGGGGVAGTGLNRSFGHGKRARTFVM